MAKQAPLWRMEPWAGEVEDAILAVLLMEASWLRDTAQRFKSISIALRDASPDLAITLFVQACTIINPLASTIATGLTALQAMGVQDLEPGEHSCEQAAALAHLAQQPNGLATLARWRGAMTLAVSWRLARDSARGSQTRAIGQAYRLLQQAADRVDTDAHVRARAQVSHHTGYIAAARDADIVTLSQGKTPAAVRIAVALRHAS